MFSNHATTKAPDTPAAPTWPLNPAIYANMATMDVDWATLAQQWIHMKEQPGQQPDNFPSAPPPPPLSGKDFEEKGEAPMEVDKDEDMSTQISLSTPSHTNNKNNWSTTGGNAGGNQSNWTSTFPSQNPPHWKQTGWNPIFPSKSSASESKINQPKRPQIAKNQTKPQPQPPNVKGYWTTKPTHKIPSLLDTIIEPDASLVSAIPRIMAHHSDDEENEDTTQTIDAAKRKTLPAWIREGLEKMEREKQKQVEREEELRDCEKRRAIRRQIEEETLKEMENEQHLLPLKSKFESDSDSNTSSDEEHTDKPSTSNTTPVRPVQSSKPVSSPDKMISYRSREEQIQNLMMAVRKNLTEILLEVTNEEIQELAKETCSKVRKKAPTAQIQRKTALTSLTGGLGLGIYADSSDDDSNSDDDAKQPNNDESSDSENDLRATIERRKQAFEKVRREIEVELEEEALAEEIRRKERERHMEREQDMLEQLHHSAESRYKDGEPNQTIDKNLSKSGRSRDKRPSRFSDPRDTVRNTHLTHVNILATSSNDFITRIGIPPTLAMAANPTRPGGDGQTSSSSDSSSSSERRHKKSKKHKKSSRKKRKRDHSNSDDNETNNGQSVNDRYSIASSSRRSISRSTDLSSTRRSRSRSPRNHRRRERSSERRRRRSSRSRSRDSRRSYRQRSRSREKHRR